LPSYYYKAPATWLPGIVLRVIQCYPHRGILRVTPLFWIFSLFSILTDQSLFWWTYIGSYGQDIQVCQEKYYYR
jgi:hypothetical protein